MSTELDIGELLDRATLAADAPVRDLEQLHGGVSSLTYSAYLDDRRVVIKVAPPGLPPVRNRDVLRQARVLRALADAPGVNVPEVLVEDAGTPPFFIMSFVPGDSYEPKKDISDAPPSPETVRARALACAEMLARLQRGAAARGRAGAAAARGARPLGAALLHRARGAAPRPARALRAARGDRSGADRPDDPPRRLPDREHAVRRRAPGRDHRLGDLVARRPAHGPRLAADLARPRAALLRAALRGRRACRRGAADPRRDARRLRRRAARPAVVRGLLPLQDGLDHGGADQAEPAPRDAVSAPRGRGDHAAGESSSAA